MPVVTIPTPQGLINYSETIEQAALATLGSAYYTRDGGPGGVLTREREYPQERDIEEDGREYPIAALNAIFLRAQLATWRWVETHTIAVLYDLFLTCISGGSSTRQNQIDNGRLSEEAGLAIVLHVAEKTSSWLESGNEVSIEESLQTLPPTKDPEDDAIFRSRVRLRIAVEHLLIPT